jgi:crotonobetainyl-CoA:carnitine CoA-transferase CaiB-like acyl-CoA transferase
MSQPLANIKVLDLSRLLPGPYCTQVLADFGAEVIKVEEPRIGDYMRWESEQLDEAGSAMFHSLNRNKKSVTLNLKDEADRVQFKKLVQDADVLIESFRPGVMERLGLGYDVLNALNEKLIYCAITGYGYSGPYKDLPGHDSNFLSYSGILQLQGRKGERPVFSPIQIADLAGGAQQAVSGILLALFERTTSGKGQFVDIAMLDGSVSLLQLVFPDFAATGALTQRGDHYLTGNLACYDIYETQDGRYLSVGALEPKFWQAFCEAIGETQLIATLNGNEEIQQQMRETIQKRLMQKTMVEWMAIFNAVDTCVAPLLTLEEVAENEQLLEREMIVNTQIGNKEIKQIGIPIKLSRTPGKIVSNAPKLGEHNDEVLGKVSKM